jgi:hypothetical protein
VKDGVLQVGDIIVYQRKFAGLGLTVQKDTIVSFDVPMLSGSRLDLLAS